MWDFLASAGLVVDYCPGKVQSVALDGLAQSTLENVLEEEKDAQKVERLQDVSFEGGQLLEQGSFEGEESPEQGSLQSLERSCGRVS